MGWAVSPSCCLTWGQIMVEVMRIMVTSFQWSHAGTAALSAYYPVAGRCWPMPSPETLRLSWASLGQSLVGSLLLSPGFWYTQVLCVCVCVCAFKVSVSTVLCKFRQLYGGVNGNLLQEDLCHTQVCRTQSPCPCGRPLLTCTSTRDIHILKIMWSVKYKLNFEITLHNY